MALSTAMRIASEWHGGQWSPLYSFASSGHLDRAELLHEIDQDLRDAANRPDQYDANGVIELRKLREFIASN